MHATPYNKILLFCASGESLQFVVETLSDFFSPALDEFVFVRLSRTGKVANLFVHTSSFISWDFSTSAMTNENSSCEIWPSEREMRSTRK